MRSFRSSLIVRYAVAMVVVAIAILLKIFLQRYMELGIEREAPFMLSLGAVMVAGWYGGFGPGLVATVILAFAGDFFFMEPLENLGLQTLAQRIRFGIFIIEGAVVSGLCQRLQSARLRAEQNEAETRSLQRELLELTDSRQRRIGHDLHDGLGQHLTGIAFMSKLLEQRLHTRGVPEAEDARKIAALVNNAIGWTRDLARGLAPVDLDREDGLATALKHLVETTCEMYGLASDFERRGDVDCRSPADAIHLYRIAQEAVNNAIKHGKPRKVSIHLTGDSGKLVLIIRDDGSGFDAARLRTGGMGLRIMRYRAKMVSGQLDVTTRPSGGTIVTCIYNARNSTASKETATHDYQAPRSPDNDSGSDRDEHRPSPSAAG